MHLVRHRGALAALLALFACSGIQPAHAVMPGQGSQGDAKRFGLDRPSKKGQIGRSSRAKQAISRFNTRNRGLHSLGFGTQGIGTQSNASARIQVDELARNFLRDNAAALGLVPEELRLERALTHKGIHHLAYNQIVNGVPVDLTNVRVHIGEDGEIISMQSSFRPGLKDRSPVPSVPEQEAISAAASDLGIGARPAAGRLVWLPVPPENEMRLAWRIRITGPGGRWVYYVDALNRDILLRYNELRFQACASSGTVHAEVFDIDPAQTPGPQIRPIRNQKVYIRDASTNVVTNTSGVFCHTTRSGKIFTLLQGPYAHVANFNAPNAFFTNGGPVWKILSTPISSPHPYSNNQILFSTITIPSGENAVAVLPNFSFFDVGVFDNVGGSREITDNDQVAILGPAGDDSVYATYIGNRGAFRGAIVPGNQYRLRLKTDETGTHNGFDVNISSFLTLTDNPAVTDAFTASFTWTPSLVDDGTRDEPNIFYQVNLMHDYFNNGVNTTRKANIDQPVPIMARVGPNLANAFYDPFHGNISFGDLNSSFALDATVVRHEYVHFVIDQIYPIINLGQFGAISEGLADYFSASSLGISAIGQFTSAAFGSVGSLRELDCVTNGGCRVFPTNWVGQIHEDSPMVSQALWEIRTALVASLGAANGQACADGLVWEALFFFPDSFEDLLDAMLTVSKRSGSLIPICGGDNSQNGLISAQFSNHGIVETLIGQDIYEPNDGIASATDISTASVITARIFPAADLDYFSIGAAEGEVRLTLNFPANDSAPNTFHAFKLTLVDSEFKIVQTALPKLDVNPTFSGFCQNTSCLTTDQRVVLSYDNPKNQQLYLLVSAPDNDTGLVSANNSTEFYTLTAQYNQTGPVEPGIVTATFDNDVISFGVTVATFASTQISTFSHAQLRDHSLELMPQTKTDEGGSFLVFLTSANIGGRISGTLQIQNGFDARFPSIGTVHLEVFATNRLGNTQSVGLSPAIQLTTNQSTVKAYNNIFNPNRGEKATIRYDIVSAGNVRMELFNVSGRKVITLINEFRPAGKGSVDWLGTNSIGNRVASGIYLLVTEAPGVREVKKIIVVK